MDMEGDSEPSYASLEAVSPRPEPRMYKGLTDLQNEPETSNNMDLLFEIVLLSHLKSAGRELSASETDSWEG